MSGGSPLGPGGSLVLSTALRSPGLRVSLAGAAVFLVSATSLVVLPNAVAVLGMLIGGLGVWGGFVWTLFSYYAPTPRPPSGS